MVVLRRGFHTVRRISIIFALMLTLALACKRGKKDEQYKPEKVERGDITMTVTATGTLSAVTTVQIGSQGSGVIARLYSAFNSLVHKGHVLAALDPSCVKAMSNNRVRH